MKQIFVPCDFSAPAQQAYKFALSIAEASKGEVLVLKVIELPFLYESAFGVQPFPYDPVLLANLEEMAKANFEKMKNAIPSSARVTFFAEYGTVSPSIKQFIKDKNIDLVVMGTHGTNRLTEFFIGSNTEKIVRKSPVPVIAIREAPALSSIRDLVFPTSLDLNQIELVSQIKALQAFFNATLHVLLVNTPTHFRRETEAKGLLEEYARHYKLRDYTLNIRSDPYEQDGIISFAKEINADMIAMATHGRKGLLHWLTGSIAEDVVNHVNCPIWTSSLKK